MRNSMMYVVTVLPRICRAQYAYNTHDFTTGSWTYQVALGNIGTQVVGYGAGTTPTATTSASTNAASVGPTSPPIRRVRNSTVAGQPLKKCVVGG